MSPSPASCLSATTCRTSSVLARRLCTLSKCSVRMQTVYRAVVVVMCWRRGAWWRFATAADRQCIEGLLRRVVRAGYRRADEPTAGQLVEDSDDQMFHRVQYNTDHVLQPLLPHRHTDSHALRDCRHNFQLSCRSNSLTDCNFITDSYLKTLSNFILYILNLL